VPCNLVALLAGVLVCQLLLCFCHFWLGDALGGMQDGVAVMLGVAAACEVTVSHEVAIVPAIAYGVACALSVAAETAKSVSHVMHSRLHILAGHADRTTLFSTAVFCGPVVYMAGAFLATRLYQHASRSERGDCKPLLGKPSPEFCPETKGLTDEGAPSLWPPAPRRPPLPGDLCHTTSIVNAVTDGTASAQTVAFTTNVTRGAWSSAVGSNHQPRVAIFCGNELMEMFGLP